MIHCYQFEGLNIVLDCYSGSIHMVDEVAYDMIQWYENESAEEVVAKAIEKHGISKEDAEECIADIDDLKTAGKLYAPDKYEHLAKDFRKKNIKIKALCLHVAHTCNLNCWPATATASSCPLPECAMTTGTRWASNTATIG